MKPRLFIASSAEGIEVAHAVQQNLHHNAEIIVWDQGIFRPSITAMESLLKLVPTLDFGIFVFTPDDKICIRGAENPSVRDNVLFELGLFTGVVGRERCFVLLPENCQELRIPTDILGMTPILFETGRSDGSFQAATGPACHTVRGQLNVLGMRQDRRDMTMPGTESPIAQQTKESTLETANPITITSPRESVPAKVTWIDIFLKNEFVDAERLLLEQIEEEDAADQKCELRCWLGFVRAETDFAAGVNLLRQEIAADCSNPTPHERLTQLYTWANKYDDALRTIRAAVASCQATEFLTSLEAKCLVELGRAAEAQDVLSKAVGETRSHMLWLDLIDLQLAAGESEIARRSLEAANEIFPESGEVLERYADLLSNNDDKGPALVPRLKLVEIEPNKSQFRSNLGNLYLALGLNDLAMQSYRKANELANESEGWILANIGNLLKNCGLYSDGIEYLNKALAMRSDSQYAHERLAVAMKLRDEESAKAAGILKDGKRKLAAEKAARRIKEGEAAGAKVDPVKS